MRGGLSVKINARACKSCLGQTGVYTTCSKCLNAIERMCIKCLTVQKLTCQCFDIRSTLDFVK